MRGRGRSLSQRPAICCETMIDRQILPDGALSLSAPSCSYKIQRLQPGALLLTIIGRETGELGRAALGEVAVEAAMHPPLHLLIDMTGLTNVDGKVSDDWTAWFRANKHALAKVDVLVPSTFVRLTVQVSQMFAGLGRLLQVHPEAAAFQALLARAGGPVAAQ